MTAAALLACVGCAADDSVHVGVGPTLIFPHALLDNVKKVTLTVYEATDGADCDAAKDAVTGNTQKPITTKDLQKNCAGGATFCGDLTLTESDQDRVFSAAGFASNGDQLAIGCAKAKVNQDALPLQIKMQRFVKPAVCGNGQVEPTEQCEGGSATDPVCDEQCHTREVLLSGGKAAISKTANGNPGDKKRPAFLWPLAANDDGRFLAFFTDNTPSLSDVTMRVLSDAFGRYAKQGDVLADYSFFLPNNPTAGFPPDAAPNNQASPTGAFVGGRYFVAFEDDSLGTVDVRLRSLDTTMTAEQGSPITINGTTSGEPGKQSAPSMAASSSGLLFIAWQDEDSHTVRGRTFNPQNNAVGQQVEISTGANNGNVAIASNGAGWVAVWESGQDVKVRALGADGTPLATEQRVNDSSHSGVQQHPSVAGLSDGRFAVAWNDRGSTDIFVQRFGSDTKPIAGDQQTHVNNVVSDGDQNSPVIAASPAIGGSYVAAWVDAASSQVRARLLGGSAGFLFNSVDGQDSEFAASIATGRKRTSPTIAVGGAGPNIAIGWEDDASTDPGIYGRRFPLPTP